MHQTSQRRQIGQIEVVGFVQNQIAAHQTQHRRNLPTAALTLGGRGQMVDGANQQRGQQQRTDLRISHRAAQHGMLIDLAFVQHMGIFVQQRLL
jgi:hypothetical protein